MAETAARIDPYTAFNFRVKFDGIDEAQFMQCSSLGVRVQTLTYRSGGTQNLVHKLPGRVEYSNVTLSYGLTESRALWDWFQTFVAGAIPVQRKNVSIILLKQDDVSEARRWDLFDCFPTLWCGSQLHAMDGAVAIETLELAFERLQIG